MPIDTDQDEDLKWSPWRPISDPQKLKVLGKFCEELAECTSAASRCIIQGENEEEPVTGVKNAHWLEDEIADVLATAHLTAKYLNLDGDRVTARAEKKVAYLDGWLKHEP